MKLDNQRPSKNVLDRRNAPPTMKITEPRVKMLKSKIDQGDGNASVRTAKNISRTRLRKPKSK